MKLKIGDKVKTLKGDQANPDSRNWILTVVKLNKQWSGIPAVVCQRPDGRKTLFLVKNLVKV